MIQYYWAKLLKKFRGVAKKESRFGEDSKAEAGTTFINSVMGRHSYCGYDCFITGCEIGSFVSIGNNVVIGGGAHPMEWVSTSPVFYNNRDSVKKKYSSFERNEQPKTIIMNDVWIGTGASIKAGITIGNGAVIGMGSVVTKNVPSYAIVGGVPAIMIRKRFDESVCNRLEESKWWEFEDDKLEKLAIHIKTPEIFLKQIENGYIGKNQ